jgi:hypothetical protein
MTATSPVPGFGSVADLITAISDKASQSSNGVNAYDNLKVLMGHVDANEFLYVPEDVWKAVESVADFDFSIDDLSKSGGMTNYNLGKGNDYMKTQGLELVTNCKGDGAAETVLRNTYFWKIAGMNYVMLKDSGFTDLNAAYASMFRAKWFITGAGKALEQDKTNTSVEHVIVESSEPNGVLKNINAAASVEDVILAMGADGVRFATLFYGTKESINDGIEWVTMHYTNIWCAVEHSFRTKGHHYKNTGVEANFYRVGYQRFLDACFKDGFSFPSGVDEFCIFHTAVHPFKLKALPLVATHYTANCMVAEAAILRFDGAPNGNAVITTSKAALDALAGETWYGKFKDLYNDQIELVYAASAKIHEDKFSFHNCSALYGMKHKGSVDINGEDMTMSDIKSKTASVASACQGLIVALDALSAAKKINGFALSRAKALKKAADANPVLSIRVTELILASVDAIGDAESIPDKIEAALPALARLSSS